MGSRDIGISYYAIILLSFTALLFPIQYGYGILTLELSEQELNEQYELEQLSNAEQKRDENFVLLRLLNPYFDTPSDIIILFENNDKTNSLKSIDRQNESFQTIKDEQLSIAEEKCKEILGGKIISNSISDEPNQKKTIHTYKIDNQIGFMNRDFEDFENYRLLQISIAEDYIDNNWKVHHWNSNTYQNNESIEILSNNNKILEDIPDYRNSEDFKNLIIQEIFQAEKIRNKMMDFRMTGAPNPYLDENIYENFDVDLIEEINESSSHIDKNIAISWSDPTYVTDKPEFNVIDREDKEFDMVKAMEFEIAKNKLNEMLHLLNSEKDDIENIVFTQENKKLNNYDREDKGFEFFKNKQIDRAEKKLMEILGQKDVHNSDYLEFEKIKIRYYSNLD